jgi:hypothetical protein
MGALMRDFAVALIVASILGIGSAPAQDDGSWINQIAVERILPPPPASNSRIERDEIAEIHRLQSLATLAAKALAKHDHDGEARP